MDQASTNVVMQYCPYCSASLVGGVATVCAECGKKGSRTDRGVPIETAAQAKIEGEYLPGSPAKEQEAPGPNLRIRQGEKNLWM